MKGSALARILGATAATLMTLAAHHWVQAAVTQHEHEERPRKALPPVLVQPEHNPAASDAAPPSHHHVGRSRSRPTNASLPRLVLGEHADGHTLRLESGEGDAPSLSLHEGEGATVVRAPQPLSRPQPCYPPKAKREGIEGYVVLLMKIDAEGRVRDAEAVEGEPRGVFDECALAAVKGARFSPAEDASGGPVATTLKQRMIFRLEDGPSP